MKYRSVTSKRQMYIVYIYIYPLLLKVSVFLDCTSEKVGLAGGAEHIYIYIYMCVCFLYTRCR